MASAEQAEVARPPILDSILQYGKLAFDPDVVEEEKAKNLLAFEELIKR